MLKLIEIRGEKVEYIYGITVLRKIQDHVAIFSLLFHVRSLRRS